MRRLHEVAAFDGRLDTVLAATFADLSRARAASLVKEGCVAVGERTMIRPATRVCAGEVLTVELPDPVPATSMPQALPLDIVYQDGALVVVDKQAGMVVHPSAGHPDGTLVNALLHHVKDLSGIGGVERPGIVHRLDRGTSGLLVVAKTDAAHASLAAQFAAKTTGRRYLALCLGSPAEDAGSQHSFLGRHARDRLRWASTDGSWGKEAVTHWRVLARAGSVCLLRCRLETGRTHQVRVHLTEAGWPLVGDPVYKRRGRRVPATLRAFVAAHPERPLLHAWQLAFDHPATGVRMAYTATPPEDFLEALACVGLSWPLP